MCLYDRLLTMSLISQVHLASAVSIHVIVFYYIDPSSS